MTKLAEIKENLPHLKIWGLRIADVKWLIQQAQRTEELENRNKQLEDASQHNGKLNEFLQKRNIPPKKALGRHVVEVLMDYVEELEKEVKHHKNLLSKLQDDIW